MQSARDDTGTESLQRKPQEWPGTIRRVDDHPLSILVFYRPIKREVGHVIHGRVNCGFLGPSLCHKVPSLATRQRIEVRATYQPHDRHAAGPVARGAAPVLVPVLLGHLNLDSKGAACRLHQNVCLPLLVRWCRARLLDPSLVASGPHSHHQLDLGDLVLDGLWSRRAAHARCCRKELEAATAAFEHSRSAVAPDDKRAHGQLAPLRPDIRGRGERLDFQACRRNGCNEGHSGIVLQAYPGPVPGDYSTNVARCEGAQHQAIRRFRCWRATRLSPRETTFPVAKEPLANASDPHQTANVVTERNVMGDMEKSLVDRCLKRALDADGTPYTEHRLAERCALDISNLGPEARTSIRMKGVRGYGLKKTRRLMPSGPPGEVQYTSPGFLHIDFPSVAMMAALRGHSSAHHALAGFYAASSGARYPQEMSVDLGVRFALEHIDVEIDPDVVEALIQNTPSNPFGNSRLVIFHLLEVEHIARRRRWKRVDLTKWRSAGLTWPLIRLERPRPVATRPVEQIYRVSDRHAKLLRLFDQADEAGKAHIEQAAAHAAPTQSGISRPRVLQA